MPLMSDKDHKAIIANLPKMIRGCPSCGGKAVTVGQDIVALQTLERGVPSGYEIGPKPIAAIAVKCDGCGYLMMFRAEDHLKL